MKQQDLDKQRSELVQYKESVLESVEKTVADDLRRLQARVHEQDSEVCWSLTAHMLRSRLLYLL